MLVNVTTGQACAGLSEVYFIKDLIYKKQPVPAGIHTPMFSAYTPAAGLQPGMNDIGGDAV
jgi:hypothetical protein